MKTILTISIVLFESNFKELQSLLSKLNRLECQPIIFLIDNSKNDSLSKLQTLNPNVVYSHLGKNVGYGAAHNIAIREAMKLGPMYHLVINPDVDLVAGAVDRIISYMNLHSDVGQVMPRVTYENGNIQRLCKLLPNPINLIGRRFLSGLKFIKEMNERYELNDYLYDRPLRSVCLSGCFMFFRMATLKAVEGFDERFFMYMEDVDLTRRICKVSKAMVFPQVSIVHGYQKGSYSSFRLSMYHMVSAVKYFNKWGWIFDTDRRRLNRIVLEQISDMYWK